MTQRFVPASGPEVHDVVVAVTRRWVTVRFPNGQTRRMIRTMRQWAVIVDGVERFRHYGEEGGFMPCTPTK